MGKKRKGRRKREEQEREGSKKRNRKDEDVHRLCVDGYAGDSAGKRERTVRHPDLK